MGEEIKFCDNFAELATKSPNSDIIYAIASSASVDRDNEVIEAGAFEESLKGFVKNGVILACHQHRLPDGSPPMIGRPISAEYRRRKLEIGFKMGSSPLAEQWKQAREDGTWRAVSVGFMPIEYNWKKIEGSDRERLHHTKAELLEVSAVPVGSNRDALLKGVLSKEMTQLKNMADSLVNAKAEIIAELKDHIDRLLVPDNAGEYIERIIDGATKRIREYETYEKPYENEHACRVADPGHFNRFRRVNGARKHEGKSYDIIFGRKKDGSWQEQAYRYPKDKWSASEARAHCRSHDGRFEAAASAAVSSLHGFTLWSN